MYNAHRLLIKTRKVKRPRRRGGVGHAIQCHIKTTSTQHTQHTRHKQTNTHKCSETWQYSKTTNARSKLVPLCWRHIWNLRGERIDEEPTNGVAYGANDTEYKPMENNKKTKTYALNVPKKCYNICCENYGLWIWFDLTAHLRGMGMQNSFACHKNFIAQRSANVLCRREANPGGSLMVGQVIKH